MRCSASCAYSLFGYCSTTVLKAAKDLRAVLGRALGEVGAEQVLDGVRRALEVDEPLHVPGVVDARMRRVLADEGLGGIRRGLTFPGAVICVDQVEPRLARLVREREARRELPRSVLMAPL